MQSPNNTPIRGHLAKKEQAVGLLESRLHSLLRTTFVEAALSVVKLARQHPELIDRELESVLQQYISVQYIYNELRKRGQISRKELWFEKDWLYLTKKDLLRFVGRETREIITNYGIKL